MAKDNNLKDFLTDVADAIREKEGSTGLINPQEFSAKIRAIETGGGGESGGGGEGEGVAENDVNLRDYDGTIVYSYTKEQFLALTELPELPTHEGLTAQGWNWSLESAQSYVADNGIMEMGANYNTSDGRTRLYLSIPYDNYKIYLRYNQTSSNGVKVSWGDGSAEEVQSLSGNKSVSHIYAKGEYVLVIRVVTGSVILGGSYGLFGNTSWQTDLKGAFALKKAEIGANNTEIGAYMFGYCINLESVSVPNTIKTIGNYAFYACKHLKHISVPSSVTAFANQIFGGCSQFTEVSFPSGIAGSQPLYDCTSLKRIIYPADSASSSKYLYNGPRRIYEVVLPKGANAVAAHMFSSSYVERVVLPDSITKIDVYAFNQAYYLKSIELPDNVTTIGDNAFYRVCITKFVASAKLESIGGTVFYDCYNLDVADFRKATKVPTLGSSNFNRGTPKIIVPDDLYDEWISATNWSSHTSKIVKASEYTD